MYATCGAGLRAGCLYTVDWESRVVIKDMTSLYAAGAYKLRPKETEGAKNDTF
jgi:hypothetical protein